MPYFKNEEGARGYVNNEEIMVRLEKNGYVRLEGRELFLHILAGHCRKWLVPACCAGAIYYFITSEFALALIFFVLVQELLD